MKGTRYKVQDKSGKWKVKVESESESESESGKKECRSDKAFKAAIRQGGHGPPEKSQQVKSSC